MPRSRAPEIPQRPSPRAPANLRTSSSDPTHLRLRTERSGGRSPRGAQSDPLSQKKLGTRIADLEYQLGQAQVELRCLKDQLSSAEAAKKAAQQQLHNKPGNPKNAPKAVAVQESIDECDQTSDHVFELQVDSYDELEAKSDELASKNDEVNILKMKLDSREKELEAFRLENAKMKARIDEKLIKITSAESEVEGVKLNLENVNQELAKSKSREAQMSEKVEASEKAKGELEDEMKRLRVQTEQWRKAADAAASVLAGEVEMNERRISERCGSMEKKYRNVFESGGGGYGGYVGSPGGVEDGDDVFGGGKRKGSGSRMFGDLWRKKGHK